MAEETITILKVGTEEAVKSVADLRENIKALKKNVDEATIGTQEYQDTLEELKVNQNALKDAMYATSGTFQDVVDSATGASKSYNSLVHQMASLKEEFRATNDEARRNELGIAINRINTELKEMDALQGNFQRNVGNYTSHWKGMSESIKDFGDGLDIANGHINGFAKGLNAIGKSPAIATFAILLSVVSKLADKVKESDTATASFKKALDAVKPVMDFISGVVEKMASLLADVIGKVSEFVTSNGLFSKIIDGVVGVGNAILKFVVAPFKGVIEAIKIFKEEGIKGLADAGRAFAREMKEGVAFKSNYQAGQSIAEALMSGVKSKKDEAKAEAKNVGEEVGKSVAEGIQKGFNEALAKANRLFDEELKRRQEEQKEIEALTNSMLEETNAEIEAYFAEQERLREQDLKDAEEKARAKVAVMQSVVDGTSTILSTLADLYEADEKNNEKNAKKIKALRVASAVIDTISGAVSAYIQSVKTYAPPQGNIIGGIQAGIVTATGMAQIAKMKSTNITNSGGGVTSSSVSAPTTTQNFNQVRNVTSASEEERLNRMASDQRVYILSSDLEADRNAVKTRVDETTF